MNIVGINSAKSGGLFKCLFSDSFYFRYFFEIKYSAMLLSDFYILLANQSD